MFKSFRYVCDEGKSTNIVQISLYYKIHDYMLINKLTFN